MKNDSLKKMFFDFDVNFTSVCRRVDGKYSKFVLLVFDTVLIPRVAAVVIAEPVVSDF
jgi:hypothetical protein